ncbi:MAG: GNAT family N-acetyltransferase [Desulfobacula sp.]|nr:GNAT family N-acetyltransferase [Desulfobacula sp.]
MSYQGLYYQDHQFQKTGEWSTERGNVTICSFCSPDKIASLSFKEMFGNPKRYKPIISKKDTLIASAFEPDVNVSLAYTGDRKIVGFSMLRYPHSDERWAKVENRAMMEVSVIEVSRTWRSQGIAKQLLQSVLSHPLKENRIIYMVGYSWTWDLAYSKISANKYRDRLVRLFSLENFRLYQANELNIMLKPENIFMARIGVGVSQNIQKQFKMVRYNLCHEV